MPRRSKSEDQLSLIDSGKVAIDPMSLGGGLPNSVATEKLVLGSIMLDSTTQMPLVRSTLAEEDFHLAKHRLIWRRLCEMDDAGIKIDRITLANQLAKHGELASVDGMTYLSTLDEGLPQIVNLSSYIEIVKEKALLRRIIEHGQAAINKAMIAQERPQEILAEMESRILQTYSEATKAEEPDDPAAIIKRAGGLDGLLSCEIAGTFDTRWTELNKVIRRVKPGQFIVVAARPACGKSVFGLDWAEWAAQQLAGTKKQSIFWSLEMAPEELLKRLISSRSSVPLEVIEDGVESMTSEQRHRVSAAASAICDLPLRIKSARGGSVPGLRNYLLKMKKSHVGFLVIDYLQLLHGVGRVENRNTEIGQITSGLKDLAMEFRIPVVALCQLNRDVERTMDGMPELGHLRESGNIEQDADMVMMLHRPDLYNRSDQSLKNAFDVYVRKNRGGKTGRARMGWQGEFTRIVNVTFVASEDQQIAVPVPPQKKRATQRSFNIPTEGAA